MKKLFRKVAHKRYIEKYITELRWETLNTVITASRTQWNDDVVKLLDNNAQLILKYGMRRRWLKF